MASKRKKVKPSKLDKNASKATKKSARAVAKAAKRQVKLTQREAKLLGVLQTVERNGVVRGRRDDPTMQEVTGAIKELTGAG